MTKQAQELIDLALKMGASQAEVYHSRSLSHPVFFEANRLKQLESSQSEGTALRLWKKGCPGLAVAYGEVESQKLVEKAIALSELNSPETIELSDSRTDIHPNIGEFVPVETLIEAGKNAISQLREAYPEAICSGEFSCEEDVTYLLNSQGLYCEYSETSINYYLGLEWVRGEDFLGIYEGEQTRNHINTDGVVKEILQRLEWAKENVSPATGRIPVLFTPNAAAMLWGTVADAINGKVVLEKSSPWSDKLGEKVISEKLTITQQPNREPYTCPFDDEGTITQHLALITQGKLEQFYSDRTIGHALGKESTGNGFRPSLGRYPTPSLVNLIVEPGTDNFNELIQQLDRGIIVDQMLGGGADLSGEFSINVDLGYGVRKGKITGRIKDTMVTGNVYNALKEVIILGNDCRWTESCYTPSIIVEGLSVIG
ncbi:TldD/PmbA family protein [Crocosphaera sp. XPORK-15E]|uniref:TldD/PmbA family protein n=1 Tax=Crocosphaera sp. XPORK-15E TaxID=3110247 RepID=UPI002B1F8A9D|nr:TldD/PmbA family protein [Crocosphaera sp. XPORK-15E]MEA5533855.1 TldD/PmbA family protein [Crocosphaera sp. XPORK-15E]